MQYWYLVHKPITHTHAYTYIYVYTHSQYACKYHTHIIRPYYREPQTAQQLILPPSMPLPVDTIFPEWKHFMERCLKSVNYQCLADGFQRVAFYRRCVAVLEMMRPKYTTNATLHLPNQERQTHHYLWITNLDLNFSFFDNLGSISICGFLTDCLCPISVYGFLHVRRHWIIWNRNKR